ncbi:ribonuclease H family protein [Nocardia australiensis]|uniref:ribonuclease H family protein n=1 Tax=Nocardia australiensis TaxID=2887191 RepID=UPI001D145DB6|nr:ribonuclease HI [Nocardia australiensis]
MTKGGERIVEIFTDGACLGNPGPGGWGAILRYGDHEKELYGSDPSTTNNRMELMAAIRALESLKRPSTVQLSSDSKYVVLGAKNSLAKWRANGWLTSNKTAVKNIDLWERLDCGSRLARARMSTRSFQSLGMRSDPQNSSRAKDAVRLSGLGGIGDELRTCLKI